MCGPLACLAGGSVRRSVSYQGGRLLGYLILGALAGWLGGELIQHYMSGPYSLITVGFTTGYLIFFARILWLGKAPTLGNKGVKALLLKLMPGLRNDERLPFSSFGVGLLTATLPCGWLHVFVLGAALSGNVFWGALILVSFWAGAVPVLWWGPSLFHGFLKREPLRKGMSLVMVALAFGVIFYRSYGSFTSQVQCH